jgi:hypothetical protein
MKMHLASKFAPPMAPSEPTFLSIDIEGAEYEALCSINWELTTPRVICVEEWEGADTNGKIAKLLFENGYEIRERSALSAIYVHKSWSQA